MSTDPYEQLFEPERTVSGEDTGRPTFFLHKVYDNIDRFHAHLADNPEAIEDIRIEYVAEPISLEMMANMDGLRSVCWAVARTGASTFGDRFPNVEVPDGFYSAAFRAVEKLHPLVPGDQSAGPPLGPPDVAVAMAKAALEQRDCPDLSGLEPSRVAGLMLQQLIIFGLLYANGRAHKAR